jgi:predicted dehydrogenase
MSPPTSPRPSPLHVAVAGTGMIGRLHAAGALRAGAELVGVAASTPESARAAAAALGAMHAFDTAQELVTASGVDVVHICTPNYLHRELVELALDAGKHVICEKPLAVSADDAERLAAAARQAGVVTGVPVVYRYHPMVREARHRVAAGEVGEVRLVHGSYLQDWLLDPADSNWRVDATLGGRSRAFADIGSHWCDLAEFVTGHRIAELCADVRIAVPERARAGAARTFEAAVAGERIPVQTEDVVTVVFRTDRGAVGTLTVSQVSPGRKNRLWFEVDGSRASVVFDQEDSEHMQVGTRDGWHVLPRDPAHLSADARRLAPLPPGHAQGFADAIAAFVADVYAAVRGEPPAGLPTFDDGARAARITDTVMASAHKRQWSEVIR